MNTYTMFKKAKKYFGQNFLVDIKILNSIYHYIKQFDIENILEVGPGYGNLTKILLKTNASKIFAIEKDKDLMSHLAMLSSMNHNRLTIVNDNALSFDAKAVFASNYTIIANLPYNIATLLLIKWLKSDDFIDHMFLMFQKEVAERIVANCTNKSYGKLSIITQLFYKSNIIFDIQPSSFKPAPKVVSSFIHLTKREKPLYEVNLTKLELVTRVVFAQRRKMLRQSLKACFKNPIEILEQLNIDPTTRPERLTIKQFCQLANLQ